MIPFTRWLNGPEWSAADTDSQQQSGEWHRRAAHRCGDTRGDEGDLELAEVAAGEDGVASKLLLDAVGSWRRVARKDANTERRSHTTKRTYRRSWLYLARRSERQGAPVLIWPVDRPTTRSAMKVSSVSPLRWLTMTPQPAPCASSALCRHKGQRRERAGEGQGHSVRACGPGVRTRPYAWMDSLSVPIWLTLRRSALHAFFSIAVWATHAQARAAGVSTAGTTAARSRPPDETNLDALRVGDEQVVADDLSGDAARQLGVRVPVVLVVRVLDGHDCSAPPYNTYDPISAGVLKTGLGLGLGWAGAHDAGRQDGPS